MNCQKLIMDRSSVIIGRARLLSAVLRILVANYGKNISKEMMDVNGKKILLKVASVQETLPCRRENDRLPPSFGNLLK